MPPCFRAHMSVTSTKFIVIIGGGGGGGGGMFKFVSHTC